MALGPYESLLNEQEQAELVRLEAQIDSVLRDPKKYSLTHLNVSVTLDVEGIGPRVLPALTERYRRAGWHDVKQGGFEGKRRVFKLSR